MSGVPRPAPPGRTLIALLAAAALCLVLAGTALGGATKGGAEFREATPRQAALTAGWWNWVAGFPAASSPLTSEGCDTTQTGHVWFLAGSASSDPVRRRCTVPTGTRLVVPVVNTLCSPVFGDPPAVEACTADLAANIDLPSLRAWVDGRPVPIVHATTGVFTLTAVAGTPFATPQAPDGGTGPAAAEGYWVFVRPLPPGRHRIRVTGTAFGGAFAQDVRYCLTVVPRGKA